MIKITWIGKNDITNINVMDCLEDAKQAVADLRYSGYAAWISERRHD